MNRSQVQSDLTSSLTGAARPRRWVLLVLPVLPLLIAGLLILPIGLLSMELLTPTPDVWMHLWATILPQMIGNTLLLLIGVGIGTLILGAGLAWLVTAYNFPGRAPFDWLLLLPMAMPSFVLGFVFMATFDFAGPVQSGLRGWLGPGARFPEVRSGESAILVMTLVLYPYVYLLARAAFREQAVSTVEAAQVMGYSRTQTFFRLVLPLARPSIAAGVMLALMEAMTDFATVRFFNFPTLSEGVVRVWHGRMDRQAATELATLLLVFALGLIALERALRGQARYYQASGPAPRPARIALQGWRRWATTGVCSLVLLSAFILPTGQLALWAIAEMTNPTMGVWDVVYAQYLLNTSTLAAVAAAVTVILALILAHSVRLARRRFAYVVKALARLATLGYAMPGAVVAVGVLLILSPVDHAINDLAAQQGVTGPGLVLTGSIVGLIYAYVVRFMSVGYSSVEASLDKVTPNMESAARTLGATPGRVLRRVHAPLINIGMATGALLVFMDVMKELPVTLLLRPFGMDTLAIWSYMLAAESFWQAAALPALTILAVGLVPVIVLVRIGGYRSS